MLGRGGGGEDYSKQREQRVQWSDGERTLGKFKEQ